MEYKYNYQIVHRNTAVLKCRLSVPQLYDTYNMCTSDFGFLNQNRIFFQLKKRIVYVLRFELKSPTLRTNVIFFSIIGQTFSEKYFAKKNI